MGPMGLFWTLGRGARLFCVWGAAIRAGGWRGFVLMFNFFGDVL